MYNTICRHYKSSHIMTTNIVIIHENVYHIIRDDV